MCFSKHRTTLIEINPTKLLPKTFSNPLRPGQEISNLTMQRIYLYFTSVILGRPTRDAKYSKTQLNNLKYFSRRDLCETAAKKKSQQYRHAARHTPSWLSHAHPPGAASALFRCRRDARRPSFGGGARLRKGQCASSRRAGRTRSFRTPRVAAQFRNRIRQPVDNFARNAMATRGSGTLLAIPSGDTCAGGRV